VLDIFDPAQATLELCFRVNYQKRYGLLELRHRPQPVTFVTTKKPGRPAESSRTTKFNIYRPEEL
jgi:hypothetical protein